MPEGSRAATNADSPPDAFLGETLPQLEAVYGFALRLVAGDAGAAQDLVQETFLRAFRSWATFRKGSNARAWLFTICRNVFLRSREVDQRRGEQPVSQIEGELDSLPMDPLYAAASDPERSAFSRISREAVTAAIDRLPDEYREAVVLCDLEDVSYAEAAEIMECPVGTVRSRLHRGRRLLQAELRSELPEDTIIEEAHGKR